MKMKLSAAQPSDVWLSLPVEDLENAYTVIITPSPTTNKTDACTDGTRSNSSPVQSTNMEASGPRARDWIQHFQSGLDDPELSPIRNVLSSTITDRGDESATEGIPSLLWDSYDLHHHYQDAADGHHHWPLWSSEGHLSVMSCSGFTEAGDLGLGDEDEATFSDGDGHCIEAAAFHRWPDLRLVHILTEGLAEEHLKTRDLQYIEETPSEEPCKDRPPDKSGSSSVSKVREGFWLPLEEEVKLELDKECKVKKHKDKVGADLVPGAATEAAGSRFEDEPSGCNQTTLNGICNLKQRAEKPKNKLPGRVYWKDLDRSGENVTKPEASLIPELWPDDVVFDPGGKSLHPLMPRKASLPMNNNLTEHESPCARELANPAPVAQHPGLAQLHPRDESTKSPRQSVTPTLSCHFMDLTKITSRGDRGTPAREIQTSSLSDECPVEQSTPQLLPDQSLELDPGGSDGLTENSPDGGLASLTST